MRDVEDVVPYAKKKALIVGEAICLPQDDECTDFCGDKAGFLGVVGGLRDVEDVVPYAKKKALIVGEAICLPQDDEHTGV